MTARGTVNVADDSEGAAKLVAERLVARGEASQQEDRNYRLAVSGGRGAARLFPLLAGDDFRPRLDWSRVELFFADERAVPPDDPESNYRLAHELLVEPLRIPPQNVHRMRGEVADVEDAAREYEPLLVEPLDFLVLGLGENAHTASLMPGSPLLGEYARRAAGVSDSPKPPPRRITITPRTIGEAREVAVFVTGADKAAAVAACLEEDHAVQEVPGTLLRSFPWYLDRDAARRMTP